MTDYNDGRMHAWSGGECPVHPRTNAEVLTRDGSSYVCKAGAFGWHRGWPDAGDIVAFRVVEVYAPPKPREFWVNVYPGEDGGRARLTKERADAKAGMQRRECIHVREVMPEGETATKPLLRGLKWG